MGTLTFSSAWEGRVVEGRFPLLRFLEISGDGPSFFTVLQGVKQAIIHFTQADGEEANVLLAQWDCMKALSHPNVATVFAVGKCVIDQTELVYVVTERWSTTLSKLIQEAPLSAGGAREVFFPVLNALSYLHENGIVFGSVDPEHIQLVESRPQLSVIPLLRADAARRGSPNARLYDAPELRHGALSSASDVWSFGITLCESLTRTCPCWSSSTDKDPDVPQTLSSPFHEIVQQCVRVDPLRRPTIEAIREKLECDSGSLPAVVSSVDECNHAAELTPASAILHSNEHPALLPPCDAHFEEEGVQDTFVHSGSLAHFEEAHLPRSNALNYGIAVVAIVASFSIVLFHQQRAGTTLAATSKSAALVYSPSQQQHEIDDFPPPATTEKKAPTSAPVSEARASGSTQARSDDTASSLQEAPSVAQPTLQPPHKAQRDNLTETAEVHVLRQVIPEISPVARNEMPGPVEVFIRVSVNPDGTVSDAAYMFPGPGNYFARIAQKASLSWEFKPSTSQKPPEQSVWVIRFFFGKDRTEAKAAQQRD